MLGVFGARPTRLSVLPVVAFLRFLPMRSADTLAWWSEPGRLRWKSPTMATMTFRSVEPPSTIRVRNVRRPGAMRWLTMLRTLLPFVSPWVSQPPSCAMTKFVPERTMSSAAAMRALKLFTPVPFRLYAVLNSATLNGWTGFWRVAIADVSP
jgi:hypothetical protein